MAQFSFHFVLSFPSCLAKCKQRLSNIFIFFYFVTKSDQKPKTKNERNINLVKLRGLKNRNTTSERILSPLYLRFIVSSVDVKEKNWSSDLQWNAVTNRHSRSVTHPCETKVIKQHLLQINLKASRSVTQSRALFFSGFFTV